MVKTSDFVIQVVGQMTFLVKNISKKVKICIPSDIQKLFCHPLRKMKSIEFIGKTPHWGVFVIRTYPVKTDIFCCAIKNKNIRR